MMCKKCGAEIISSNSKFCTKCGAVESEVTPTDCKPVGQGVQQRVAHSVYVVKTLAKDQSVQNQ